MIHSLTILYTLPSNLKRGGDAFIKEAFIRNLTADILSHESLVEHFFNNNTFTDSDAEKMINWYENDIPPHDDNTTITNSFLSLPLKAQQEIVALVNRKWNNTSFPGLLYPQITLEEFSNLITTGYCQHEYICYNNAYFAFFVRKLREKNLISGFDYQKVLCSGGRLYSRKKGTLFPPLPNKQLHAKRLAATIAYIIDNKPPYTNIEHEIIKIAKKWPSSDI